MSWAADRIPLPISCRPRSGSRKFPCRRVYAIACKPLVLHGFICWMSTSRAPKCDFSLLAGKKSAEAERGPVGGRGERRCPYWPHLTSSAGLGMLLPSNRDIVRPDPDVA